MTRVYSLKGHYQGKTIVLGGFQFIRGVLVASLADADQHDLLAHFIAQWGATEDKDGQRDIPVSPTGDATDPLGNSGTDPAIDVQPDGRRPAVDSAGAVSDGATGTAAKSAQPVLDAPRGGPEESVDPAVVNLRKAIFALDPAVKDDWTTAGKPALAAIERRMGYGGVTRAQVDAVAPGYNRVAAQQKE